MVHVGNLYPYTYNKLYKLVPLAALPIKGEWYPPDQWNAGPMPSLPLWDYPYVSTDKSVPGIVDLGAPGIRWIWPAKLTLHGDCYFDVTWALVGRADQAQVSLRAFTAGIQVYYTDTFLEEGSNAAAAIGPIWRSYPSGLIATEFGFVTLTAAPW